MLMYMKLSRKEKSEITKERLYRSAIYVTGRYGFEKASGARIAGRAKIAIGTFYNYYATREALLTEVVLKLGQELRQSISVVVPNGAGFFLREKVSFQQYFRFLRKNPYYIKLLNEAEIFLPEAYRHLSVNILDGYRRVLQQASDAGEIRRINGLEIDGVALMLMAARHYYGQYFLHLCDENGEIPDEIIEIYLSFIHVGLDARMQ